MCRKLFLKIGQRNAELRKTFLIRGEDYRGSGGYQSVVDVYNARYGLHDFLRLCRHLLQGFVIVSEYLHFDGLRGTHQVAQEVGDTLPEADGHQRNGLRYFPAQVADDFGGTYLSVCLQLNEVIAEIARSRLERHAECRAARVSLHIGMRHDDTFHLTARRSVSSMSVPAGE